MNTEPRGSSRRRSRGAVILCIAATGLALTTVPAQALQPSSRTQVIVTEAPLALPGPVTDRAGALSANEKASVSASLQQLGTEKNITLYVVLVKTFNGMDRKEWATSTFDQSGMGTRYAVLAIATQDRVYSVAVGSQFPIDQAKRNELATDNLVPQLRQNKWADGIMALADAYRAESGGSSSTLGKVGLGVGVGVVGLGAGAAVLAARRRKADHEPTQRPSRSAGGEPPMSLPELDKAASRELVAADENVRAAERDLGFAQAEFGDAALTTYVQAHAQAKNSLTQAFSLRQQLDDAYPETDEQKVAMLTEIRHRCAEAQTVLQEQSEDFARLRDLGRRAPEVMAQLRTRLTTAEGQVPRIAAAVQALTTRYSAPAVAPVVNAPEEIQTRVGVARQQLNLASDARGTEAAVPLHNAEEALAQVDDIVKVVDGLSGEIDNAAGQMPQAVNALSADVSGVSQADARTQQSVGAALAQARAALGYAQSDGRSDPVGALKRVVESDAALDKALAGAQVESDRGRRAAERLPQVLDYARRELQTAQSLISGNRGVVGTTARTRAAEAERTLAEAQAAARTDPAAALELAQRAADLAASASAEAQRDRDSSGGGYGGGFGGGIRRGGIDPLSVIIGASMGGWGHGGGFGGGGSWGGGGGSWGGGSDGGSDGGFGGGFGGGGGFSGDSDGGRF